MQGGARAVNKIVSLVGEDNAAASLLVIQFAIEGAPAILSLVKTNLLDSTLREPVTNSISNFIDQQAFYTQDIQDPNEKNAYSYLSDQLANLGFDFFFSGSYSIIRSSKKVGSAGSVIDDIEKVTERPSWRQSEKDVLKENGNNAREQVSYKDNKEVPNGTKGSVKPDIIINNKAVEVKNYKVENSSNLINNVSNQVNKRATELPQGMTQEVVIDFRGQDVTISQIKKIKDKIIEKTNGALKPENINFKLDN